MLVDRSKESMLSEWYTGSFKEIARRKEYAMGVSGFDFWTNSRMRSTVYKLLCRKIRLIFFRLLKDGALFTGAHHMHPKSCIALWVKRSIKLQPKLQPGRNQDTQPSP